MPTVSGPLADVTGSPTTAREVWLRAPEMRTEGGGLTTTEPHRLMVEAGHVTFECSPGPAVMVIAHLGGVPEKVPLSIPDVDGPVTLARAAEDAPDYTPAVIGEVAALRRQAEQAADRAETAADDVEAAISGAADQVVQAIEGDRIRAEDARIGAEEARDEAGGHASTAGAHAQATADDRDATDQARAAAVTAQEAAEQARDVAAGHAGTAADQASIATTRAGEAADFRDQAAGHEAAASSHADASAGSAAASSGSEVTAGQKAAAAAGSATTAQEYAQQVIDALANAEAYQDVVTAIGGMSADWQSDIATAIADLVGQAPETLDTLAEVAQALGNDPNFATTVMDLLGQKVSNTDPRLSDARTPTTHTHPMSQVDGLADALDGKSNVGHGHTWDQVSEKPGSFPSTIALVAGLQAALDGKSATGHTHTKAQVGLGNVDNTSDAAKPVSTATQAALDVKADTQHVDARPAMWLWDGIGSWSPPAAANSGDSVLNLDSGEVHSITEV